jgi:hypothetical protein
MFTRIPNFIWYLPDSDFVQINNNAELKLDKDFYPLRPDGDFQIQFINASTKPNLVAHYTEWACSSNSSKYSINGMEIKNILKVISFFY